MTAKRVDYDPSDPVLLLNGEGSTKHVYSASASGEGEECFYQLCTKYQGCGGYVPCFRFKRRSHAFICYLLTLTAVSLFVAIVFPLVLYRLVDDGVNASVVIDSPSASSYETWQTNTAGKGFEDVKIFYNVYLFDLQNPQEVLQGQQPVVVEMGPYAYREYFYKFDISWSDGGDTVTYNNYRYYVFDQEASGPGLSEQDEITLPYPSVIGFEYLLDTLPPEVNAAFDYQIEKNLTMIENNYLAEIEQIYSDLSKQPANSGAPELMAELEAFNTTLQAYFDGLIQFVDNSPPFTLMFKSLMCPIPSGISPFFKQTPSKAWFGWLRDPLLMEVQGLIDKTAPGTPWTSAVPGAATNYSSIADARRRRNVDVVKTGKKNPKHVGQFVRYQNMTSYYTCISSMSSQNTSEYVEGEEYPACAHFQHDWDDETIKKMGYAHPFATPYANRVLGNDAQMYGRPVTSDKVQSFVSDIYRSVFFEATSVVDWNGLSVKSFQLQLKDLQNATQNPENAQYYNFGPMGLLNATQAAGIPTFISFPHFLNGDDRLVAAVKGLSPDVNKHETYLLVEPQTGLLAEARKRLQVNYLMKSYSMPELDSTAPQNSEEFCANVTSFITQAQRITKKIYDKPNCRVISTFMQPLLTCFTQPSTWKMHNDAIYFPYGWVSEEATMPKSYADDIQSGVIDTQDLAVAVRFWSLIVAVIFFAMVLALLYYIRMESHQETKYYRRVPGESESPLDFAFNPNHQEPLLPGQKPRESYSFSA